MPPQRELLYQLRYAIDIAQKTNKVEDREAAVALAQRHPQTIRSTFIAHNLGLGRMRWLEEHGAFLPGEAGPLEGSIQMTATPTKLG